MVKKINEKTKTKTKTKTEKKNKSEGKKDLGFIQGHRKRVMRKYQKSGLKGWHDYEILEMALFYVLPRVDTKLISKKLLKKFQNIYKVINADPKHLKAIEGVGEYTVNFFRFLKEFYIKISEEKLLDNNKIDINNVGSSLDSSEKVFQFLKLLIGAKQEEEFVLIFLNNRNKVIGYEILAQGVANEVFVYPRKIVEKVLYYNAMAVILAHNHPSGDLEPSKFDVDFTNKIKITLQLIDVVLLDHLIISNSDFFSFSENDLIIH